MTAADPEWEADADAAAQDAAMFGAPGDLERDGLLADAELTVRDEALRAAAEPRVFAAWEEPEAGL